MDGWVNEKLPEGAEAFFAASQKKMEEAEKDTAKIERNRTIFSIASALIGVLGMAAGLTAYIKTPVTQPPGYIGIVDNETGVVHHPVPWKDAPLLFGENVKRRAMSDFIKACESYIPQTWARVEFHNCMIRATPQEQKARAAEIGPDGTRYPVKIFGTMGWALPTGFLDWKDDGTVGHPPGQIFKYTVRYERTEVLNGRETRPRYTAEITFSFHPELKIEPADALVNDSMLQVISFSTIKDSLQ